ncbi:recombinase family protein [Streptomyces sp. NPDC006640]|uniref:recombinase family protein n=1 Tax=unclassified Streptomyces TaxID=2593676 RepID=UPI00367B1C7B
MGNKLRLLGALRESKLREHSDSFDGQENDVRKLSDYKDGDLVHITRDRDVSGREVRLFQRPEFGEWLKTPDLYDGIAAQKMDRITRRPVDLYLFLEWLKEHGKFLVTHIDSIDTRTPSGKRYAELMGMVGSWEWEAIQERNEQSHERSRAAGRWHGGHAVPFGYKVEGTKGNYRLVVDELDSWIVRWMVKLLLEDGLAFVGIARKIEECGIPTPKGANTWGNVAVQRMLTSPNIVGRAVHKGEEILDEFGLPMERAEPLISLSEWQRIKKVADERKAPERRPRSNATPYLRVVVCGLCNKNMYRQISSRGTTPFYLCRNPHCDNKSIGEPVVSWFLTKEIMSWLEGEPRYKKVHHYGVNHSAEIEELRARISRLRRQDEEGDWDDDREGYRARMDALRTRLDRLSATPVQEDWTELVPTGETVDQVWASWDTWQRGEEMRDNGVQVVVGAEPIPASEEEEQNLRRMNVQAGRLSLRLTKGNDASLYSALIEDKS